MRGPIGAKSSPEAIVNSGIRSVAWGLSLALVEWRAMGNAQEGSCGGARKVGHVAREERVRRVGVAEFSCKAKQTKNEVAKELDETNTSLEAAISKTSKQALENLENMETEQVSIGHRVQSESQAYM